MVKHWSTGEFCQWEGLINGKGVKTGVVTDFDPEKRSPPTPRWFHLQYLDLALVPLYHLWAAWFCFGTMCFGGDKFGQRFVDLWSRKAHGKPFTWRRADSDHGQQEKCCLEKIGSGFSEVIQSNLINVLIHPHFCAAAWGVDLAFWKILSRKSTTQTQHSISVSDAWKQEMIEWLTSEIPSKRIKMSGFSWNLARWKTEISRSSFHAFAVSRLFVPSRCLADVFTFSPWRCRVSVVSTHFKNIHLNERQQKMPRSKDIYSGTAKVK